MDYASIEIAPVIIKEYIAAGIDKDLREDYITISPNKLPVIPGLIEPDVLYSIQQLPGINSPDESASGVYIRGGSPDQNLILWDGIPVYSSGHFFGMVSSFNPSIVEDIKVFRSNYGSQYGGRVSGVVDIQSKKNVPEKFEGGGGINFTHANLYARAPFPNEKGSLTLSIRRSLTDIIETPTTNALSKKVFSGTQIEDDMILATEPTDFFISNNELWYGDANAQSSFQLSPNDELILSGFYSKNVLDYQTENFLENLNSSDLLDNNHTGFNISYKRKWNENNQTNIRNTYSNFSFDYAFLFEDETVGEIIVADERSNRILDRKTSIEHNLKQELFELKTGLELNSYELSYDLDLEYLGEFYRESNDQEARLYAGYADFLMYWNGKFTSGLGLRLSKYSLSEELLVEPRFSVRYVPHDHLSFKASASLHNQYISQVIEFDLTTVGLNNQIWVLSDDIIPIIKGNHLSIGMDYNRNGFVIDLEFYKKSLEGITSLTSNLGNIPGLEGFSTGTGSVDGLDLMLRKKWNRHNALLSYSIADITYRFPDISELAFNATHDQRHTLEFTYSFSHYPWNLGAKFSFGSGRPFTDPTGIKSFIDGGTGELVYDLDYEEINAERLPRYYRVDMSVAYAFPRIPKSAWSGKIAISLLNLMDKRNIASREYFLDRIDPDVNLPELFLLERNLLGFTPNLSISFKW